MDLVPFQKKMKLSQEQITIQIKAHIMQIFDKTLINMKENHMTFVSFFELSPMNTSSISKGYQARYPSSLGYKFIKIET